MHATAATLSPRRIYRQSGSLRLAERALALRAGIYRPEPVDYGNPLAATLHALTRHTTRPAGHYTIGKRRPLPPVRSPRTAHRLAWRPPNLYRPSITFTPLQAA